MRVLTTILTTGLVAGLAAQAVDPGTDGVRVRFHALSFDEAIFGAIYLAGEHLQRIDIPADGFTPQYSYAGPKNLRFVTVDPQARQAAAMTPELNSALQRLRRAQAGALQISHEHEQTVELIQKIRFRSGEENRPAASGDLTQLAALNMRLQELGVALAANTKETEEANLSVLRLESIPSPAPIPQESPAGKQPGNKAGKTTSPTTECTFPKNGSYLLIFYAVGAGQEIMTLDDDAGVFPYGSHQFINLSGRALEIRTDGRTALLKANTRKTLANQGADFGYSLLEIHSENAEPPTLGCTLRLLRNPDLRTLTFLLPDPDNPQLIRCRSIEDLKPAPADKPRR